MDVKFSMNYEQLTKVTNAINAMFPFLDSISDNAEHLVHYGIFNSRDIEMLRACVHGLGNINTVVTEVMKESIANLTALKEAIR